MVPICIGTRTPRSSSFKRGRSPSPLATTPSRRLAGRSSSDRPVYHTSSLTPARDPCGKSTSISTSASSRSGSTIARARHPKLRDDRDGRDERNTDLLHSLHPLQSQNRGATPPSLTWVL